MLSRVRRPHQSIALRRLAPPRPALARPRCHPVRLRSDAVRTRVLLPAATAPDARSWRRPSTRASPGTLDGRGLATALDDPKPIVVPSTGALSEAVFSSPYATPRPPTAHQLWSRLPPLVVPELVTDTPRGSVNKFGVPGDVSEMVHIFDACLQVGKLDRAAQVLHRLGARRFDAIDRRDVMALHNQYLRIALDQLIAEPSAAKADAIHRWYELNIRQAGLPETPETIAFLLKAALIDTASSKSQPQSAESRRGRLIMRYMDMLQGDSGLQVLYMTDILTDQDRALITQLCPAYNLPIGDESSPAVASSPEPILSSEDLSSFLTPELLAAEAEKSSSAESFEGVRRTPQVGLGLGSLAQALSLFELLPRGVGVSELTADQRREYQLRLERDSVEIAISRWRVEHEKRQKMGIHGSLNSPSLQGNIYVWHQELKEFFKKELELTEVAETSDKLCPADNQRCLYGPILRQSTPERLSAICIIQGLTMITKHGLGKTLLVSSAMRALGDAASQEALQRRPSRSTLALNWERDFNHLQRQWPGPSEKLPRPTSIADMMGIDQVPITIRMHVGAAMLKGMLDTMRMTVVKDDRASPSGKVSQVQQVFLHNYETRKGKKMGVLMTNRALVEILKREPPADFITAHLPMLCEPQPWTAFNKGGFLTSRSTLVRVKENDFTQQLYAEAAISRGDMQLVFKGLDILSRTAWRINQPVLDAMLEAWNSGEAFLTFPPLDPQIQVPPEPDSSTDPNKRRLWLKGIKEGENRRMALHSQRCFINLQLMIANAYRGQTFYLPHNIDFRGRAYPIPPLFNHMGADHARALFLFDKGKELGPDGLFWLRVHLANVYGYDKASLSDRQAFAHENWDNIVDSATNPMAGRRWWKGAEDPWQCLAVCMELKNAMESPDATKFVSHFPVHQDGTCNGLQHYAALGGDSWGARQVNLEPGDRPADVYSAVAELVEQLVSEDLQHDNPIAKAVTGKIKRKVVKQTVMTNVYGVTYMGAKKQILKQIEAIYPTFTAETDVPTMLAASYLAFKVFKAMSSMFEGAHEIQKWFGECGWRICRSITAVQLERIATEQPHDWEAVMAEVNKLSTGGDSGVDPAVTTEADLEAAEADKVAIERRSDDDAASSEESAMGAEEDKVPTKKKRRPKTKQSKGESLKLAKPGGIDGAWRDEFRSSIVWTTPLRLPVAQPYRKNPLRTVDTSVQSTILGVPGRKSPVAQRKQLQAFPPNFIHSLDASHMILAAIDCHEQGISFAAVHDSFWTHAGDVTTMNTSIRDSFIRIHEEDVTGRLASEFAERARGSVYLAVLDAGSPVGKKVLEWRAHSPLVIRQELLLEKKRQDLLASDDPQEVLKGQKLVTAASIVEEWAREAGVAVDDLLTNGAVDVEDTKALSGVTVTEAAAADEVVATDELAAGDALDEGGSDDALLWLSSSLGEDDGDASILGSSLLSPEGAEESADAQDEVDAAAAVLSEQPQKKKPASKRLDFNRVPRSAVYTEKTKMDGLVEWARRASHEAEDGEPDAPENHNHLASTLARKTITGTVRRAAPKNSLKIWLPTQFPPLPKKGDFDVTRARESNYFFS